MSGFSLDISDFAKGFDRLAKAWYRDLEKALFRAGSELIHDSNKEEPKTPVKEGHLKGSVKIEAHVTNPGETTVFAGFSIEYAAQVHERVGHGQGVLDEMTGGGTYATPASWTEPGSGPKFLESKLMRHRQKYFNIMAVGIKNA